MNKLLLTSLFALFSKLRELKSSQPGDSDLAKLKISMVYVKGVESIRLLFLSFLALGLGIFLLLGSVTLFYVVVFAYMPWTDQTKIAVGLWSAAVFLFAAVGIFLRIFDQGQWVKMFHVDKLPEILSSHSQEHEPARPKRF